MSRDAVLAAAKERFARDGYEKTKAVRERKVWELPPEIFLQPGPALFVDGLDQMFGYMKKITET